MKIVAKNTQQITQDLVANSIKHEVTQLGSQKMSQVSRKD